MGINIKAFRAFRDVLFVPLIAGSSVIANGFGVAQGTGAAATRWLCRLIPA